MLISMFQMTNGSRLTGLLLVIRFSCFNIGIALGLQSVKLTAQGDSKFSYPERVVVSGQSQYFQLLFASSTRTASSIDQQCTRLRL